MPRTCAWPSTAQPAVPKTTSLKTPKHFTAVSLNNFHPFTLTSTIMKCFERLVLLISKSAYHVQWPLQFGVWRMPSPWHLSHVENSKSCVRMLFIDFSSAFNTIMPSRLITKFSDLGINTSLCNWILDFLTNRPLYSPATVPHPLPWTLASHRAAFRVLFFTPFYPWLLTCTWFQYHY